MSVNLSIANPSLAVRQEITEVVDGALPGGFSVANSLPVAADTYLRGRANSREIFISPASLTYTTAAFPSALLIVQAAADTTGQPGSATTTPLGQYRDDGVSYIYVNGLVNDQLHGSSGSCGAALMHICLGSDREVDVEGAGLRTGNAFAASNVAAGLAVVASIFPDINMDRLDNLAFDCAEDLGTPGVDGVYGRGRFSLDCMITPEDMVRLPTGFSRNALGVVVPIGAVTGLTVASASHTDDYGRAFTYTVSSREGTFSAFWRHSELLQLVFADGGTSENFELSRGRRMFVHSTRQDNARYGAGMGLHQQLAGVHLLGGLSLEENSALLGTVSFHDASRGIAATGHLTVARDWALLSGNFMAGASYLYSDYHGGYAAQLHSPALWSAWNRQLHPYITFSLTGFYTPGTSGSLRFSEFSAVSLRVIPVMDFTAMATLRISI